MKAPSENDCTLADDEIWDEHTLKKVEPNEMLELVLLDPSHSEGTFRIDIGMALEMRGVM